MIKATLRGLFQRKLRLALATFAIVLAVMFLAGAMVLTSTLNARFTSLFTTISQDIAVQVSAKAVRNGEPPLLTDADLAKLSNVDGVGRVSGDASADGLIPFRKSDGKAVSTGAPSLGAGVGEGDDLGILKLSEGQLPRNSGDIAITAHTAKATETKIGDDLKVFIPSLSKPQTFRITGIVIYEGGRESLGGETLILFELKQAQQMFYGKEGVYTGATMTARDGVTPDALKQKVIAVLPSGFEAKTGKEYADEQSSQITSVFSTLSNFILMPFVVIAAIVGIFLIYNTFNIIVAQRARELALLRALGAGWGQVTLAVLLEALIVGLVGATLGLAAGVGIGAAAEWALSNLMDLELPSGGLVVTGWAVLWSYVVGVLVTVVAAFVPAIKAATVPPVAAMREVVRPDKSLKGLSITGFTMTALGAGLVAWALTGIGSATLLVLAGGMLLVFLGVALLSPLLSKPVVRALGVVVGRGQPGKLGVRNALRNPRRTAVTAAALMIGVTVITVVGVIGASFKATITDVVSKDLGTDIIIQAGQSGGGEPGKSGFDAKVLDQVRAMPGVTQAMPMWYAVANNAGTPVFLSAADVTQAQQMFAIRATEGELRKLALGEAVVDDVTARDSGWKLGTKIKLELPKAEREVTIVGIYKRTPVVQGLMLGEPAVADFAGPLAFVGFVTLSDGTDTAAAVKSIEGVMADFPGVIVGDQSDYIKQQGQIFDILLAVVTVLLGVALFIALLGILNTLLLSIVERTRELGLVRAIGLGRSGVMGMITVESILIAFFGCLTGIVLGIGLGALFVQSLINQDSLTTIALPWANLITYLVVAVIAGVIAAVWPAWRAARLNVLDAIAYE
jgi:putative ABC transport system permease protein